MVKKFHKAGKDGDLIAVVTRNGVKLSCFLDLPGNARKDKTKKSLGQIYLATSKISIPDLVKFFGESGFRSLFSGEGVKRTAWLFLHNKFKGKPKIEFNHEFGPGIDVFLNWVAGGMAGKPSEEELSTALQRVVAGVLLAHEAGIPKEKIASKLKISINEVDEILKKGQRS